MQLEQTCTFRVNGNQRSALIDAINAWHRGEALSLEQAALIEEAQVITIARAVAVQH